LSAKGESLRFTEVIAAHPQPSDVDRETLLRCVAQCLDCGASCTACADASLSEGDVQDMVRCIRLCLDCADACDATGRTVTRQTAADPRVMRALVQACAAACDACAEECERHAAHHEHCRICAEVCRQCRQACDELLAAMGG
jgi:uncharacterized membrane protein